MTTRYKLQVSGIITLHLCQVTLIRYLWVRQPGAELRQRFIFTGESRLVALNSERHSRLPFPRC
jgi:hypothetical protein